jgi:hypothetical protein
MLAPATTRNLILVLSFGLLVVTRFHHFGPIPDASWAAFLIAGYGLKPNWRWVFPLMMLAAVLVDYAVISRSGMNFWSHYCVSPGYWFLLPAYFAMWMGGAWLCDHDRGQLGIRTARLVAVTVLATSLCHLLSQGGFYWLSSVVSEPTFAGWAKNYADWWWPYTQVVLIYVGIAAALKLSVERLFGVQPAAPVEVKVDRG